MLESDSILGATKVNYFFKCRLCDNIGMNQIIHLKGNAITLVSEFTMAMAKYILNSLVFKQAKGIPTLN